jgi:hypothetical protein
MGAPVPSPPPGAPGTIEYERWLDEILTLQQGAAEIKCHVDTLKRDAERGLIKLVYRSTRLRGVQRRELRKNRKA